MARRNTKKLRESNMSQWDKRKLHKKKKFGDARKDGQEHWIDKLLKKMEETGE